MISHPYVEAAVAEELDALRNATEGGRAQATFKHAAAIGSLVGAGGVSLEEAEEALIQAGVATGLPQAEVASNVRRGLHAGMATPRVLPPTVLNAPDVPLKRAQQVLRPTAPKKPMGPPAAEVRAVWEAALPVTTQPDAARWLESRALDPASVEDWDLCRVAPAGFRFPRWAWSKDGGSWSKSGHRLVFRTWDSTGAAVSMRVRCLDPGSELSKSLAPSGCTTRGHVLADSLGVQVLQGNVPDWWQRRLVVILEGEPDWLTWASKQREGDPEGPVCFGVESGSWEAAIADRIPDRAEVVIRTHHDGAGDRYAMEIATTLSRRCSVYRSKQGAAR